jgi:hypothetical protein
MKPLLPCLLLLPLPLFAALEQKSPPTPPADADKPLLVWDVDPALRAGLPRNFRTTNDPVRLTDGPAPDATGLAGLRASGGAEFTAASLKLMLAKLPGPVTIFDLRAEDHGFVNGEPISWYATNNWANAGKTHAAIVADESGRLGAFVPGESCSLADDRAIKEEAGVTPPEKITVVQTETEGQLVAADGAAYVRITVSDHARPTDAEVDRFILAVRQMPPGGWAHFHCRAGKGRTTTFMALYDMLRDAGSVALPDIIRRQSLLIGDYDLLKPNTEGGWKTAVFEDRAAFVRAFYDYARANPNGRPQLWSEWLKTQP